MYCTNIQEYDNCLNRNKEIPIDIIVANKSLDKTQNIVLFKLFNYISNINKRKNHTALWITLSV